MFITNKVLGMTQNQKGNIFVLSLVMTLGVISFGLVVMMAFAKKTDFVSRYERKSNGMGRLEEELKFIQPFTNDWLASQRTSLLTKDIINKCIPQPNDYVPQDFSQCPPGTPLSDATNQDLWKAYQNAPKNTLTTFNGASRVLTLPLVDVGDRPIAGPESNPALFDESGLPCTGGRCQFSVLGYMIKENPVNSPGNLVFAFRIQDLKSDSGVMSKKDRWVFIPMLTASWNRMPVSQVFAQDKCPIGSFAVGFLPNRKVMCRDHEMECMDGQYLQSLDENGNPICKQLPIFQDPSPSFSIVHCASWGWVYTQCPYTLQDPNSSITGMSVYYQESRTTCIPHTNYWYSEVPPYVWVNIGCRASFTLDFKCNTDYYYDPTAKICKLVDVGQYSPNKNNGSYNCSKKPPNSHYTGRGGGTDACPWDCDSGYILNGGYCILPPTPTPTPSPTVSPTP